MAEAAEELRRHVDELGKAMIRAGIVRAYWSALAVGGAALLGWALGEGEGVRAALMGVLMCVAAGYAWIYAAPAGIGQRTVAYGYHTWWLHPWMVALGWWRTFGFPWDPRLWVAFFVHDLGYRGLPNLDGPEGEQHPEWGARVMERWFDRDWRFRLRPRRIGRLCDMIWGDIKDKPYNAGTWYAFVRYHSRFLAKADGKRYSALCVADKLAIVLYPRWLFLWLVSATGEVEEYMKTALRRGEHPTAESRERWYRGMTRYVRDWWEEHRDLRPDGMTRDDSKRTAGEDGVWR